MVKAILQVLYEKDMNADLVETVWETLPESERKWVSQIVVNKIQTWRLVSQAPGQCWRLLAIQVSIFN